MHNASLEKGLEILSGYSKAFTCRFGSSFKDFKELKTISSLCDNNVWKAHQELAMVVYECKSILPVYSLPVMTAIQLVLPLLAVQQHYFFHFGKKSKKILLNSK